MPLAVLPDEGIQQQAECILQLAVPGIPDWQLRLFVNDLVPDAGTVLADLVEASWAGYSRVSLTRSAWGSPVVSDGCVTLYWGATSLIWNVDDGPIETIYGHAYVDPTAGVIRLVQRWEDSDIEPISIGGRVLLYPRYTLTSGTCAGTP